MTFDKSLPRSFGRPAGRPVHILFVCLGNICRSPAAEAIFDSVVEKHHAANLYLADSAGTGRYHIGSLPDRRMRVHASRRGYTLDHICRQVNTDDFLKFDLIVAMDRSNADDLRQMAPSPEAQDKVVEMARWLGEYSHYDHIPDPYYDGDEGFELVITLLEEACQNLFDTLETEIKS